MDEDRKTLTVAAIGDLHASETTAPAFRDLFAEMAEHADVLALCGDLTNLGKPKEAELLADALRVRRKPIVAVLGNHDYECGDPEHVKSILRQAGVHFVDDEAFQADGVGFAGVKGFGGGFDNRMLGAFGEPAIKQFVAEAVNEAMHLENTLKSLDTERIVAVLNYAPIAGTVEGEPAEIAPFLGSSRLAETLDRFENVRAILHGHAHHGTFLGHTPKGTPVYNVAQTIAKDGDRPYALITV